MRIIQIAFKNINSLSGEHEIDFTKEPFTYSSLYAITGPTGSGKSSILDAISLALYNVTPRMGRLSKAGIDTGGAILTRGQKEAYAKVTYACKAGVFRSEWHISTARTGNLRDYSMQLFDLKTDKALDYKKGDIPKANEARIGLSYDQFNKSVMLAQGEFAEFLKAPKKDRGDLLEKITGSGIYRKIGIAVFQKYRAHENKTKDLRIILDSKKGEQKPKEEINEKKVEQATLQKEIDAVEKQVVVLNEQNRRIIEVLQKQATLEQSQQALQNSKEEWKRFLTENGEAWQKHKKLLPHLSDLQTWEQIHLNLRKLQEEKESLDKEKSRIDAEEKQLNKKILDITQEEVPESDLIENFDAFYVKYEKLEAELKQRINRFRECQATADATLKSLNLQDAFTTNKTDFVEKLESKIFELQNHFQQLLAKVTMPTEQISEASVENQERRLRKFRQAQLQANEIKNLFQRIQETSAQIKKTKKKLSEITGETSLLETQEKLAKSNYDKLELERQNAVLTQSLEEHRQHLKPDEACPLCGSLEHPYAAHRPTSPSAIEEKLAVAKQEYEKARKLYAGNIAEVESLTKQMTSEEKINSINDSNLKYLLESFDKAHKGITETPVDFDFEKNIKIQEEKYRNLQTAFEAKKMLQKLEGLLPTAKEMLQISTDGKILRAEIKSLYAGNDFKKVYQNLRDAFLTNRNTKRMIARQEEKLLKDFILTKETLDTSTNSLKTIVHKVGFDTIKQALHARLKDAVYLTLENQHQSIQQALQKATTQIELQQKDILKLKEDLNLENKEKIRQDLIDNQEKLDLFKKQDKELHSFLDFQSRLQEEIYTTQASIEVLEKEAKPWLVLQELIGDAQGRKFNDYAQDMTLTHLLQHANNRLESLNKRYKIDKPTKEEGDNLMVIDRDMGNQRRAISTLSGGETFMASLALALALSDLAARNVQIESMFIDEGFGTLDPESLDQTLDALERLQIESSKLIGIISHVDSLKERISTQIQLTQDGKGYSKMEIVG